MLIFLSIPSPLVRVQLKACRISLGVLFRFTPSLFFDLLNTRHAMLDLDDMHDLLRAILR